MRVPSFRALLYIAGVAVIFAAACRSPQEPTTGRAAELLGARIPAVVAPGTAFRLVAYFGRGACDAIEPVTELTPSEASIGMRLRPIPVPAGAGCPLILISDSVVVTVAPPITLPYTVRLQRAQLPDSVVVVRASEPAG
jgi:hypothetical protein